METTLLLRLEQETKEQLRKVAEIERRSMTSLILSLIDKKLNEVENATATNK